MPQPVIGAATQAANKHRGETVAVRPSMSLLRSSRVVPASLPKRRSAPGARAYLVPLAVRDPC
jgi:hypothetical protein